MIVNPFSTVIVVPLATDRFVPSVTPFNVALSNVVAVSGDPAVRPRHRPANTVPDSRIDPVVSPSSASVLAVLVRVPVSTVVPPVLSRSQLRRGERPPRLNTPDAT